MRIVTWNCNGAFRRKFAAVETLNADVLVIQECENPEFSSDDYRGWAGDHAWVGYGKNKGIGIFPRRGQSIEPLDWATAERELFLAVRVDSVLDVVGVWTQDAKPAREAYIAQFWHFLAANGHRLHPEAVICGDFNSNEIWDKAGAPWAHAGCVEELARLGFQSLYHVATGEAQGQESQPTFYLYRHPDRPYHIDFAFAHTSKLRPGWDALQVGDPNEWLKLSDHVPLIFDI